MSAERASAERVSAERASAEGGRAGGQMNPQVWAFGGAKGGVGRSVICAAVACALVRRGARVIMIDFDLGSANLHTLMGVMQPKANLEQWILGQAARLDDVCSPTPLERLSLISGASSIYNPSHPTPEQLRRVIHEALQLEADYILIDLGAGIHPHTLDFFNVAGRSFIVTTPEPTSIQNSYAFYRAALLRRLEVTLTEHPWLEKILRRASLAKGDARITSLGQLLDMVRELNYELSRDVMTRLQSLRAPLVINRAYPDDEPQVLKALGAICRQYLHTDLEHALTLPEDKALRGAVRRLRPLHELEANSPFAVAVGEWVGRMLSEAPYAPIHEDFLPLVGAPSFLSVSPPAAPRAGVGLTTAVPSTPGEALLRSAISALNEVQRLDEARAAQAAGLAGRDWKAVAWGDSPAEAAQVREALYESSAAQLRAPDLTPTPLGDVQMRDPVEHEVVCFEEEVRTDLGWFHLKTADLAPFSPAIRTSIYQAGERLVLHDKSYRERYEHGARGADIAKQVERLHHESAEHLKRGGAQAWWAARALS